MPRFTVSSPKGEVLSSDHRTALGAIQFARKLTLQQDGVFTVSQFADRQSKTGRPVAYIGFTGEWDWLRNPLEFWNDGSPVI